MAGPFTIWKFPLPTDTDEFTIDMGGGFTLSLQVQDDVPCLWSTVLPDNDPPYPVQFVWVGTGQPIPDKIKSQSQSYTGTVQLANGLVLHLFRVWP
jgi:hypothetical protein